MCFAAGYGLKTKVGAVTVTTTSTVVVPASGSRVAIGFFTTSAASNVNLTPYGVVNTGNSLVLLAAHGIIEIAGDLAGLDWQASIGAGTAALSIVEYFRVE